MGTYGFTSAPPPACDLEIAVSAAARISLARAQGQPIAPAISGSATAAICNGPVRLVSMVHIERICTYILHIHHEERTDKEGGKS